MKHDLTQLIKQKLRKYHVARQLYGRAVFVREFRRNCELFGLFRMPMWKHTRIQGFLMPNEAIVLYDLAKNLRSPSATLVEIGSWLGKSSIVIGAAIKGKKGSYLYCIDPFDISGDASSIPRYKQLLQSMDKPLLEQFILNINEAGLAEHVTPIKGYSYDVVKAWNRAIDFLFIDGDHAYEAVKRDFTDWSPYIVEGGWIAFHDTHFEAPPGMEDYKKGPGQVVQEYIANSDDWANQSLIGTLYIAQKGKKCA